MDNEKKSKTSLYKEFNKAFKRSKYIFQFKCYYCRKKPWWGPIKNKICFTCGEVAEKLKLEARIGIGWFKCRCGRIYAGFSQGDVTSKCHGCQIENYPKFIVRGNKASKNEKTNKHHYCDICKGNRNNCPIVNEVLERESLEYYEDFYY
jgi:hypothetical protein